MKKELILIFSALILAHFVLALGGPLPHAFYGNVFYSDGKPISGNLTITAAINGSNYTSEVINGNYDNLVVTSDSGGTIYFYLQGLVSPIDSYPFQAFNVTELNFTTTLKNPNPPSPTPTPSPSPSSSSSGGGGGAPSSGNTIVLTPSQNPPQGNTPPSGNNGNQNTPASSSSSSSNGAPITGGVIGFVSSGWGIAIVGLFLALAVVGVVMAVKRKPSKNG